ncbi:MAG: hypothetical protein VW840_20235, partial [Gammaproteobacteria bacterium]
MKRFLLADEGSDNRIGDDVTEFFRPVYGPAMQDPPIHEKDSPGRCLEVDRWRHFAKGTAAFHIGAMRSGNVECSTVYLVDFLEDVD